MKRMTPDELAASGYLQEANRLFFHPHGLELLPNDEGSFSVLDRRDEGPEGVSFPEGVLSMELADAVEAAELATRQQRCQGKGFYYQPIGDPSDEE